MPPGAPGWPPQGGPGKGKNKSKARFAPRPVTRPVMVAIEEDHHMSYDHMEVDQYDQSGAQAGHGVAGGYCAISQGYAAYQAVPAPFADI